MLASLPNRPTNGQAGRLTAVKLFVVVSGLPASGKTTLARRLASVLELPLIDKDDILDRLFAERGIGNAVSTCSD